MAAVSSLGVVALLGFLLLWGGLVAEPVSAMEKMAEKIREAKSCKRTEIVHFTMDSPVPGEPRISTQATFHMYWIAPGSSRSEKTQTSPRTWKGPGPESTSVHPAGKPGVYFYHRTKTFHRSPARQRDASAPLDGLLDLGKFSGEADRELGTKEIGGKKARGFQIDMKKMDRDALGAGTAEIWIDTESNLPVLVRYEGMKQLDHSLSILVTDIQWDMELDPKLFDPTPPEGYTDATPEPLALEEQVRRITEAFRIYAEASGGHYPEEIVISFDAVKDLCKMLGVDNYPIKPKNDNERKARRAWEGFDEFDNIKGRKPDYAYYGKTVGPNDKDKVLLRWKLDDGKYQVIFGDLHSETVTAARLRGLEGK